MSQILFEKEHEKELQQLNRIQEIKKKYEKFSRIFKEVFEKESTIEEIKYIPIEKSQTIFEFETPFDSKVFIKFSLVLFEEKDEVCYGKISFEKFMEGRDNDVFWYLFVDDEKKLRPELAEEKFLDYFLTKNNLNLLIINVLDKYMDKYLKTKN